MWGDIVMQKIIRCSMTTSESYFFYISVFEAWRIVYSVRDGWNGGDRVHMFNATSWHVCQALHVSNSLGRSWLRLCDLFGTYRWLSSGRNTWQLFVCVLNCSAFCLHIYEDEDMDEYMHVLYIWYCPFWIENDLKFYMWRAWADGGDLKSTFAFIGTDVHICTC